MGDADRPCGVAGLIRLPPALRPPPRRQMVAMARCVHAAARYQPQRRPQSAPQTVPLLRSGCLLKYAQKARVTDAKKTQDVSSSTVS